MATKKLSKNMKTALLAADADGWIRKSDAPVSTAVALIDRELIGVLHVVSRGDGSGYVRRGHYLTEAGKAKVAELRATQCANPVCDVHDNEVPEICAGKAAEQALKSALDDAIRVGDLIEIRKPGKRKWAMRITKQTPEWDKINGEWSVRGTQVRMTDGAMTRVRSAYVKPGEYIIVERAKPATKAGHSSRCRAAIYAGTRFAKDWPRDPERCDGDACKADTVDWNGRAYGELTPAEKKIATRQPAETPVRNADNGGTWGNAPKAVPAEQPRKTVTAKVNANRGVQISLAVAKLTEAQVDVLHLLGAPEAIRRQYWMLRPHGRSLLAMRDRLYVERTSNDLTEDGRDAYLRCQPTGRLPEEFSKAWAGTKALTAELAPAVEPDGPACLTDGEADELGTKTAQAIDTLVTEIPTLDELMVKIALYGERCFKEERYRVTDELHKIRHILEYLYRKAGR